MEVPGTDRRRSFWGWGHEDAHLPPPALGRIASSLGQRLGTELRVRRPPRLEEIELRRSRVGPHGSLAPILTDDRFERCLHSYGRSFRDVVRSSRGEFPNPPDLVAFPQDEADVERLLDWCSSLRLAAIPFGGGSSVVGGVEPDVGDSFGGVVTIDMAALGNVREVDTISRAALVEGGTLGPALEDQLRPHGLTLRHFPQSFEFSTLGGWIATRSGGHFATRETRIDDFVESLSVVTPAGLVETGRFPSSGAGPVPEGLFLGSEGALGIITEAWVRLHQRPVYRARATIRFEQARGALDAVRALAQSGLEPANCRLLDPAETLVAEAGDGRHHVLLIGFESADHPVGPWLTRAAELCRDHSGQVSEQVTEGDAGAGRARQRRGLGRGGSQDGQRGDGTPDGAADNWRESFLGAPYVRDALVLCGAICETFETAVTWDRFDAMHAAVVESTRAAIELVAGGAGFLTWRLTHVYPDGAAPYYTVVLPGRAGSELEQLATVKEAATEAMLANGGTITHHHGVGRDHRAWWERERSALYGQALGAARKALDPAGICNPGSLLGYRGAGSPAMRGARPPTEPRPAGDAGGRGEETR